jgi:hypothetical protein
MVRHFPRPRPLQKPMHREAVYLLTALLSLIGLSVQAQTTIEPTSATDATVKIHNSGKIFLFRSGSRAEARGTERLGQSLHKRNHRTRTRTGKQAQVFRNHNHFARKENNTRSRHRNTRRHT